MPSAPTIAFDIRPSRALASIAALVRGCGMVAVLLADTAWWIGLACCLAASASGVHALGRYAHPRYARASGQGGEWVLIDAQDRSYAATLHGHRRIGAFVQVAWEVAGSRFTHLLVADNSDADTRRRLLLVLAHGSAAVPEQASA